MRHLQFAIQNPKSKIKNFGKLGLVITSGDPCGVGPEVILKSLATPLSVGQRIAVIGDLAVFEQTAKRLKQPLPRWTVISPGAFASIPHARLVLIDLSHSWRFTSGRSSERAGAAAAEYLDVALDLIRQGLVGALVTAPVTKWAIERSRGRFEGQTEYLARALRAPSVVMMFVSPRLRVALLTRHLALREVAGRVTEPLIRRTILLTAQALRQGFGIRRPRLAVCGLNPHAGEAGLFGDEERRLLEPALRECRRRGIRVEGPFAADGFFAAQHLFATPPRYSNRGGRRQDVPSYSIGATRQISAGYDAVICWYHDQGLIPFKLMARDAGCQLSVGLPIVRTSPDHGSALDIAGQGRAHPGSMRYAIALAARLASRAACV